MKKIFVAGLATLGSLGVVGSATAGLFEVKYITETTVPVLEIADFSPSGASMIGMKVTATFENGTSETLSWSSINTTTWGVQKTNTTNGWSLFESGNTYYDSWTLTSTSAAIQKIVLDGLPGDTVFDTSHLTETFSSNGNQITYPIAGTAGSMQGWTFSETGSSPYPNTYTVTYSGAIYLKGENWADSPVGDLYRYLTIDFGTTSFNAGSKLTFRADTDKMTPVPEPTTLLLFATGLAGLAAVGRHRRN